VGVASDVASTILNLEKKNIYIYMMTKNTCI